MRQTGWLTLGLGLCLFGCSDESGGVDLLVQVRTDLAPGLEFTGVTVEVIDDLASPEALFYREAVAVEGQDYLDAHPVGSFRVAPGTYSLRVQLADRDDRAVLGRAVVTDVSANTVVTVVMTRSCRGVTCEGGPEDVAVKACLGGACVDPHCTEQTLDACGVAQCTSDADCAGGPPCATSACLSGACASVGHHDRCDALSWCDATRGCVPRPVPFDSSVPEIDSAMPDAGTDGAPDAAADAGTPTDATVTTADAGVDATTDADAQADADATADAIGDVPCDRLRR
jgi:hypothetical protein